MSIPVVDCPHCGPKCFAGAAHNARAEDGYMYVAPAVEVQDGGFEEAWLNSRMGSFEEARIRKASGRYFWDAALASHAQGETELPISGYTFSEFQSGNIERCRKAFPMCDDWTLNDWAVALSGEVGEMCNLLKKDRRGLATDEPYDLDGPYHESARQNVLSELADIITYADLMMSQLSADTGWEVLSKFNEVSGRIGYPVVAERKAGAQ